MVLQYNRRLESVRSSYFAFNTIGHSIFKVCSLLLAMARRGGLYVWRLNLTRKRCSCGTDLIDRIAPPPSETLVTCEIFVLYHISFVKALLTAYDFSLLENRVVDKISEPYSLCNDWTLKRKTNILRSSAVIKKTTHATLQILINTRCDKGYPDKVSGSVNVW